MKSIVVDASVAIKWFIPEIHSIVAAGLLNKKFKLLAPDLIFAEVGNILWKKLRLNEVVFETAKAILDDFKKMPFDTYESEVLLDKAWEIAITHNCTVYDSLYVALASTERSLLATADKRLYNSLKATSLSNTLLWVEDIKNII